MAGLAPLAYSSVFAPTAEPVVHRLKVWGVSDCLHIGVSDSRH